MNVGQNQDPATFVEAKDCVVDKDQIGQKMDVTVKLVENIFTNVQIKVILYTPTKSIYQFVDFGCKMVNFKWLAKYLKNPSKFINLA